MYNGARRLLQREDVWTGEKYRYYYDGIRLLLVRKWHAGSGKWRTEQVNALRPGQIGHIWATRKATAWNAATGVATAWDDGQAYHYDVLGNTIALTNRATGAVVARPAMEAYGTLVSTGGQPAATASGTQYWQTTKWRDPALGGLGYFNARWYDERTVQWSGKDSAQTSNNMYEFLSANPSNYIDFDGYRRRKPGDARNPKDFRSNCKPKPGATLPGGKPLPTDGNPCGPTCFDFRQQTNGTGPVALSGPTMVNPTIVSSADDGKSVTYYPTVGGGFNSPSAGAGAHVGVMAGGCVINCHGNYVRYYDPTYPYINGTMDDRTHVDTVIW